MNKNINPHKQSLRTKIGIIFSDDIVEYYNTDDWTHLQLGGTPGVVKICDLYSRMAQDGSNREMPLFKTTLQAINNWDGKIGKATFEGGTDHVTFEDKDGRFRLFLRPANGRPIQRIYPTIVHSTTLMID